MFRLTPVMNLAWSLHMNAAIEPKSPAEPTVPVGAAAAAMLSP